MSHGFDKLLKLYLVRMEVDYKDMLSVTFHKLFSTLKCPYYISLWSRSNAGMASQNFPHVFAMVSQEYLYWQIMHSCYFTFPMRKISTNFLIWKNPWIVGGKFHMRFINHTISKLIYDLHAVIYDYDLWFNLRFKLLTFKDNLY